VQDSTYCIAHEFGVPGIVLQYSTKPFSTNEKKKKSRWKGLKQKRSRPELDDDVSTAGRAAAVQGKDGPYSRPGVS